MKTLKKILALTLCILTLTSLFVFPAFADAEENIVPIPAASSVLLKKVSVKSVKLNKTVDTLVIGNTLQLKATVTPSNASNKKVTFSTSDSKVATVSSSGLVKAIGVGVCTITAKANNGKSASCKLVVARPVCSKPVLNKTNVIMLGKPVQLSVRYATASITWSTSNKKVATVSSNGLVTPKGYGTCTISAKIKGGQTLNCTVEVRKTNRITRSFTPAASDWNMYKMSDTMTVVVDGLTGKIVQTDCYQSKRDWVVIASIGAEGIKCYSKENSCAYFRSTYKLNVGLLGIGKLKLGVDAITVTYYYKLYNDGTLKFMKGECDDLLGVCMTDNTYFIIDDAGNFIRTKERP